MKVIVETDVEIEFDLAVMRVINLFCVNKLKISDDYCIHSIYYKLLIFIENKYYFGCVQSYYYQESIPGRGLCIFPNTRVQKTGSFPD